MRLARALGLVVLVLSPLALAQPADIDKSFGAKLAETALSSAASKGTEFAVKFVAGWIYNISCKPEQQTDAGSKALCSALGSVSGKSDEEWKKKIESKLEEISGRLHGLEKGQQQILTAIRNQHSAMDRQFNQAPSYNRVTAILTTIDSNWGRFKAELDPKTPTTKQDLDNFARDIVRANLHSELGDLNSLLSHPIGNAQPLLAYPFYEFRQKWSHVAPREGLPFTDTYDYAEKKFAYYRTEQQKGYLMYLWAAEVLESECELGASNCQKPPITSAAFSRDFDRYTNDQVAAFDAAANGMLLAYSNPEAAVPNFLAHNNGVEPVLMRLNYLNATLLGNAQGAWGEVITADGDPWDGKIVLDCSGRMETLAPAFSYTVNADTGRMGSSIDWWSRHDAPYYNEVHFTPSWRINHYKLEDAKPGACAVRALLPDGRTNLPWTAKHTQVANVTKNGETLPVGVFYALQRAGGTWALADGKDFSHPANPKTDNGGDATKKDARFDWVISPNHHEGFWMSLFNGARVAHTIGNSFINHNQNAKVKNYIYAFDRKAIYFPDGGTPKLHIEQHQFCEKVCRDGKNEEYGILDYDVENSEYEAGKLTAVVAVYLDPQTGFSGDSPDVKNGIVLDGSYKDSKRRETKRVADKAEGTLRVTPGTAYHLQELIYFDLLTHTNRFDATHYRLMGKITPKLLYFTK